MRVSFTTEEIKTSINKLKNGRSPGIDNLNTELIKHGPNIIHEGISEIFNIIAETSQYPEEIKERILISLPKVGKKPGPPGHLRPIILLSVLCKIRAISMVGRSMEKLQKKCPLTQAVYQQG